MKIRNDYVTNSSSSSFIVSKKGELNEKQKEALIAFIQEKFLGKETITKENFDDFTKKSYLEAGDRDYDIIKKAIDENKPVRYGWVSFEGADWEIGNIYERIWDILEKYGDGNFEVLQGDLSY